MSVKTEKDKAKQLQDKCQSVLNTLLRDEDNKYCVDCDSKGPRWASWNIGVFLCIRCAGIHRNLGVHISKVKSVNLDTWTPEQVVSLQQMGNSRARAVYEANLPDNFRRPQSDSALESFIRAKYEHKKYIAREWVPPALPKVNWEKEIDEEIERQKRKKKTVMEKKSLGAVEVPQLPKPTNPSPKPSRSVANNPEAGDKDKKDGDLLGLQNGEDTFSNFISAPSSAVQAEKKPEFESAKNEEESFFNQTVPAEKEKVKLDKDSILALYANTPANTFTQFPNMQPQGAYQQPAFPPAFGGFPQQQQQQFPVQNGAGQFPTQWAQQWGKQGAQFGQYGAQYPAQGQFGSQLMQTQPPAPTGQFVQFQQPSQAQAAGFGQVPNPFFGAQGLQQQFGNMSLGGQGAAAAPTLATNVWQ
ncbi:hypothetical protein NQ318_017566 [Aromia moschata]|uniref:Arf-GAP domain-containing protein n=1 Tax=Aromia moschata TaxID=1265417 RepID=A0AAV8Z0Y0_9CUCU|nr:hypothetical protein NQ318_017566 [Aromia moschata]